MEAPASEGATENPSSHHRTPGPKPPNPTLWPDVGGERPRKRRPINDAFSPPIIPDLYGGIFVGGKNEKHTIEG